MSKVNLDITTFQYENYLVEIVEYQNGIESYLTTTEFRSIKIPILYTDTEYYGCFTPEEYFDKTVDVLEENDYYQDLYKEAQAAFESIEERIADKYYPEDEENEKYEEYEDDDDFFRESDCEEYSHANECDTYLSQINLSPEAAFIIEKLREDKLFIDNAELVNTPIPEVDVDVFNALCDRMIDIVADHTFVTRKLFKEIASSYNKDSLQGTIMTVAGVLSDNDGIPADEDSNPAKTRFVNWINNLEPINDKPEYANIMSYIREVCEEALGIETPDACVISHKEMLEYFHNEIHTSYISEYEKLIIPDYNPDSDIIDFSILFWIAKSMRILWQKTEEDAVEVQGLADASPEELDIDASAFATGAIQVMFGQEVIPNVYEDEPEKRQQFLDRLEWILSRYDANRR